MDAALFLAQLDSLDRVIGVRQRNALAIIGALKDLDGVALPEPTQHAFTKFYLSLRAGHDMRGLTHALLRNGSEPELVYRPLHLRYGDDRSRCPVAERLAPVTVALPVRPGLSEEDCLRMAAAIRRHLSPIASSGTRRSDPHR